MFFDDPKEIIKIAKNNDFSIFIINQQDNIDLDQFEPNHTHIVEEANGKIRIDQIRDLLGHITTKSISDRFIIVKNAESMNEEAGNAFLKLLEEPREHHHFVFFADSISSLLPTILSRAKIYFLRQPKDLESAPSKDPETITLAKRLISASPNELVDLANELSNKKLHKNPREDTLSIVSTAIELLYKSYFKTKSPRLLRKLQDLIILYDNLSRNGHIKLHLVADLC